MRATILYGPRDIRVEDRPDPTILEPTDAIITITAAVQTIISGAMSHRLTPGNNDCARNRFICSGWNAALQTSRRSAEWPAVR